MNEAERRELEELKARQADLLGQLLVLGQKLDAFERRIAASRSAPVSDAPRPESAIRNVPPPKAAPIPPLRPVTPPPIIPTHIKPSPGVGVAPNIPVAQTRPVPQQPAPTVAAPISASSQTRAAEPPPPVSAQPAAKKGSLEMRVGTYWLVRIGIVMLLTSLVFFGTYAYQNFIPRLGASGKVALLYLASGCLLGIGTWLQRKQESLKNYAQVLQAGGLAAVYFTTYAAHHFPNLEVIHSALLDGVLLLGWAGFMTWLADRKKSEVLALFAVLLAYYTSVITHAGLFTLYSNLVLTGTAVFFLVRNRWAMITFASLAATYTSYAFWRFFDAGQWHWATPSEGLWTGNYFLMGYWLLFSAAVFFSKHETFNGERRAAFLTLNNGAFFSAFLLTMFQVHQGGFWKFSLAYGAVLLALSALARPMLPKDRLASDSYLTQGLLLVTLGFLTHLSGFKLSLVLAVESVILVSLGQMLKSRVMQTGSLIAAALATGWAAATMEPFDHDGLICGVAIGGLMLFNAFYLRRCTTYEKSPAHPRTIFYTALSFVVWFMAAWENSRPQWRGLALAGISTVILLAARPLGNQVLRYGAWGFAAVALGWQINELAGQLLAADLPHRIGLTQGILVGAIMIFNALWEKRSSSSTDKRTFPVPVSFFSALGLGAWLITTIVFTPREFLAPLLAVEALLLTAAFYPLRLRELALFGQTFLLSAQALWLYDGIISHTTHPWWNPVVVIAASLALAAWWQRQKTIVVRQIFIMLVQGLYALAVVGLFFFWLEPEFTAPSWLAFASVLAIGLTIYAVLNRFWLLAAAGQIFMFVSAWQFCRQLLDTEPVWYLPLVPVAAFCLLSFGAIKWFEQQPDARPEVRDPVLGLGLVYRVIALMMSIWWVHKYIPARENIWALALLGLMLFFVAGWRRNREMLIFGAAFTLVGLIKFWLPFNDVPTVYWPNFLAILALLVQQRIAKRATENYRLPAEVHTTVIVIGGLSLWLLLSRWILQQTSGFYLTAGWSALALTLFIGGMASRERVYRWLGLTVLACAMGRVVIFDVWKLETLYRIFTFLALGLVLLILGFIYNKYQEKIKEWL